MNSTYHIILGKKIIATVSGTEYAYTVYKKTTELADLVGDPVYLTLANGTVIAKYEG